MFSDYERSKAIKGEISYKLIYKATVDDIDNLSQQVIDIELNGEESFGKDVLNVIRSKLNRIKQFESQRQKIVKKAKLYQQYLDVSLDDVN